MSLVKKFIGQVRPRQQKTKSPLTKLFLESEDKLDFPYALALNSLKELEAETSNQEDFFQYLVEDSIFASLYATFYEQILFAINQNPELALPLIEQFGAEGEERERIIAQQTHYHFNFILNKGLCPGCPACENHADVSELLDYYQKGDINFFMGLYVGMQAIQFSMEQLLYEVIPINRSIVAHIGQGEILQFRKFIFEYCEKRDLK